jgi:hypothetical protein
MPRSIIPSLFILPPLVLSLVTLLRLTAICGAPQAVHTHPPDECRRRAGSTLAKPRNDWANEA